MKNVVVMIAFLSACGARGTSAECPAASDLEQCERRVSALEMQLAQYEPESIAPLPDGHSDWQVVTRTSTMDDTVSATLARFAIAGYVDKAGQYQHPRLAIVCVGNTVDLVVRTGPLHLMAEPTRQPFRYRFDKTAAVEMTAGVPTTRDALIMNGALTIVRRMLVAEILRIEFTAVDKPGVVAVFDMRGLSEHVHHLKRCLP